MENLKVILLKNGGLTDYLVAQVTELDEEPSVFLENCYKVVDGNLEKYPKYSSQRDLFLTSDSIFTIVDPSEDIQQRYQDINE